MAQAARLSLRMQKELKLLLSDPPPGASFPFLSTAADAAALSSPSSSSLTAIDAEIEGPEGTVYAGGNFRIRIQIPERYPFQPPVVTFSTPIYHPNIDNGGRICLDILNLPPKGAWQPSLNISTVITSIGLLLSEPNPDDGLMCEASQEFKYNRQAFDLKARTMTEKYAKASSGMVSSSQGTQQTIELRSTGDIEVHHEIKTEGSGSCIINSSKPSGMCKKLSLDLLVSRGKDGNVKANEVTDPVLNLKKQMLSLNSPIQPKQSECDRQNSLVDQQVTRNSTPTEIQAGHGSKLQSSEVSNYNQQEPDLDPASKGKVSSTSENYKRYTGSKRLSLGFSVASRDREKFESENLIPDSKLTSELLEKSNENVSLNSVKPEFAKQARLRERIGDNDLKKNECKAEQVLAKEEDEELQDLERDNCKPYMERQDLSLSDPNSCSVPRHHGYTEKCHVSIDNRDTPWNKQVPDPSLTVIVLDSDDSDQEDRSRCKSSKLSLLSKRPSWGDTKKRKALVRPASKTSP